MTEIDVLTLCNACDWNQADPKSPAGYCRDCEGAARAQTCRGFRAASDTLPCQNCSGDYAAHGQPGTAR